MRFIRKEFMVTTIFNKELIDDKEILTVFANLFNERIEFSMILRKFIPSDYDFISMSFEKVRIKKMNEDGTLDVTAFKKGVKTNMKNISPADIAEINATTAKYKILDVDSDPDRFDLLDL